MFTRQTALYSILITISITGISLGSLAQGAADSMLNFIRQNEARSSFYLQQNNIAVARLNENKLMPLASTVKIIVAIEFAKQASNNLFSENQNVSLKELDKYYIPDTDGGAHPAWIKYETGKGHVVNDSVKMIDVARGMIMFSSNANTEYLMDLLGFDNVKSNIRLLGLQQHTAIYPLVSSLFMYQNPRGLKEDKILKEIKNLSEEEYAKYIYLIHNQLKHDSTYKEKFRPQDLSIKMQKLWSDRLPASTTKEYVKIASVLNDRRYFDANTYGIIAEVLETIMENPANQGWLSHAGMKGGSTMFVLTNAVYATLKNGTKIEMASFFNNLTNQENTSLQSWTKDFRLKILSDESFRKKIKF